MVTDVITVRGQYRGQRRPPQRLDRLPRRLILHGSRRFASI